MKICQHVLCIFASTVVSILYHLKRPYCPIIKTDSLNLSEYMSCPKPQSKYVVQWFSNFSDHLNDLKDLLKHTWLGLTLRLFH